MLLCDVPPGRSWSKDLRGAIFPFLVAAWDLFTSEFKEGWMKRFHTLFVLMIAASLGAVAQQTPSAQPAPAAQTTNDTSALEQKVRDLEDRLVLLEGEIRQMKAHGTQPPAAGAPATPEQGTAPATTT